jgi:hypothetical protein
MPNDDMIRLLYVRVAREHLATDRYLDHLDSLEEQRQALPPGEDHDRVSEELLAKLRDIVEQHDRVNAEASRTVVSVHGSATPDARGRFVTTVKYSDGFIEKLFKTADELEAAKAALQEEVGESMAPAPAVAAVLRAVDQNMHNAYEMTRTLSREDLHSLWSHLRPEDREIFKALESNERDEARVP